MLQTRSGKNIPSQHVLHEIGGKRDKSLIDQKLEDDDETETLSKSG